MWSNPQFPADLVTFTEEILNGKLYFLVSEIYVFFKGLLESPSRPSPANQSLSRSSSIRSIPSAPQLSKQHPSNTVRRATSKSPSLSPKVSPSRRSERRTTREEKEKASSKSVEILSSPVSKLYQFTTQNESFGSPQISKDVTKTKFVLSGF